LDSFHTDVFDIKISISTKFMNPAEILAYYSREDVQEALLKGAKDREAVGVFRTGSFGQRPNTIIYPQDILSQVRSGVIEFHSSLEKWKNPMVIHADYRTGFDLILDLDCEFFEHGKTAAIVLSRTLKENGVDHFSVKFSGNIGFHVGIPWKSIPNTVGLNKTVSLFPGIARKVALYIRECMRNQLEKELLKGSSPEKLAEQSGKPLNKIMVGDKIDPFQIVDIDPVLISPRHLFRMAYSLSKKSYLASLPLKPSELKEFEREQAQPGKIKTSLGFLDSGEEGEGEQLFREALDWLEKNKPLVEMERKRSVIGRKIPLDMFPPCVRNISQGLKDGRRRSLFIMINFLSTMNWKWDDIERHLIEWNKKNMPSLSENEVVNQVRYHRRKSKKPPPNCINKGFYQDIEVCRPDATCGGGGRTIKNPVNYPLKLIRNRKPRRKTRKHRQ